MANLEKLQQYRAVIRQLLTEYASYKPSHGDIEIQTVFDPEGDHYQVVALGWNKRIFGKYQLAHRHPDRRKGFLGIRLRVTSTVAPWKPCHHIMLAT
jgi:hypothetical protein